MSSMRPVLLAVLLAASHASAQTPVPRFRSGAEVIAIDVTVINRDGGPVADLTAGDFEVRVEGKPRAITSAQFLHSDTTPRVARPDESSNTVPASGRLLLIVTDTASPRSQSRAVVESATELLKHLGPGDLAGVTHLPDGGGVGFTTDHARVVAELKRLRPATAQITRGEASVYISEALDFDGPKHLQWPKAIARECGDESSGASFRACVASLEQDARTLLIDASIRANATVQGLERLMKTLEATGQPVTLVLIADSLVLARDPAALSRLAEACAEARVTLHVIQPAPPTAAMTRSGFSSDPVSDAALHAEGLEQMAARTRGAFHRVVSTGADTFERIGREISGYYLLGIETAAEDRRARRRRVDVTVARPGVTVRARSMFTLANTVPATSTDTTTRLRHMLEAPVATTGLPIRLTTRTVSGEGDRVRVLIAAEIGDPTDQRERYHVGLIAIDEQGAVKAREAATTSLEPARSRMSPSLFTTSLLLPPSNYTLRLAVVDAQGRSGSVHHVLAARLREWPRGWQTSDFVVANQPTADEFPPFNAASIVDTPNVAAVVEVLHDDRDLLNGTSVHFEIDGTAVEGSAGSATSRAGMTVRSFASMLAPGTSGEHELRAVISAPGMEPFVMSRTFSYDPQDIDPFDPAVMRRYIELLERRSPVSGSLALFVARAKAGQFIPAPDADTRPDADLAMVTFVGGLAALRDNKPALARALFQQTLRTAPGFEGAEFYLALLK